MGNPNKAQAASRQLPHLVLRQRMGQVWPLASDAKGNDKHRK
jgi:hypothetical protein